MSLFSKIRHFTTKLIMNWLNPEPEKQQTGTQLTKASSDDHIKVVYGTQKVPGTIVFMNTTNPDDGDDVHNDLLHIIIVWCEGNIEGVQDLLLNDISITDRKFNAHGSGRWAYATHFISGMVGYTNPELKSAGWDTYAKNHHLSGLACSYIRLEWSISENAPFTGVPDISAIIKGRKVKNLNTGVVEYSENPAYCTADYLTNPVFGKNLSEAEYDLEAFKAAGLIAQTPVPVYQGATQTKPLFTCNLTIDTSASLLDNVELLGKSMRALMPIVNGKLTLIIEQDEPPTPIGLNEKDFLGKVKYDAGGKDKRYNRVIVEYIDKDVKYSDQDAIYPEPKSELEAQWIAEDNGVLLEYRFKVSSCNNYYEARQMARIIAMISRESLNFTVQVAPIALRYTVGDIIPISHAKLGWQKKPFRLIKSVMLPDGTFNLTLREHQPYIYNWLSGDVRPPIPDTILPDPRSVNVPTNLASSELNDGQIKISWQSEYSHFELHIYKNGVNILTTSTPVPEYIIASLDAGDYEIDVRAASKIGFRSDWVTFAFTVALPALPQPSVDAVTYNTITLSATVTGASLGTTFEWQFLGLATEPAASPSTATGYTYIYTGLVPDKEYAFKVRTKNIAGVSPWVDVRAKTSLSDLLDHISDIPLEKLSPAAQTLIDDMNTQVDRLRPETAGNLPSLIIKNIDAITGINSKVEVIDADNPNSIQSQLAESNSQIASLNHATEVLNPESPTGLPAKIGELTSIVDVINTENPNNLQGQLEESKTQITNLNRVTDVLNPESPTGLPATVKASQASIAQQQANQEDLALSVIGVAADYTSWRTEYERRALKGEVLIDAAVYIDPKSGKITNRAFAYTDQSFNSATLRIDGVVSKIELTAKELTSTQKRMTSAEAELVVQAGKISQRATFSEVESQIAGALEALQPAYSWQFNSGSEGFNADSHNPDGFIVTTKPLTSPALSYNAQENPIIRLRVRKHASTTWLGDIYFNGSAAPLHLPEPTGTEWETVSIDATGATGYAGTITGLEFNLGTCDIDSIEIGKRSANDLALKDITARTSTLEVELNAVNGTITQLAKTSWVEDQGYQTQSDVSTKIDSFNTTYNVSAILQEITDNNIIVKANAAQTWVDGAEATITNQVSSILNSENGVTERIGVAEQTLDAIGGEIAQTITQVSGLEIDAKDKSINDILTAYNQMILSGDLAAQGAGLASAQEKLSAVNSELESVAKQSVDLAVAFNKNTALFNGLNVAFANERTASSKTEQNLRAEIKREGTQSVAAANERLEAVVGYCVNASGERVDQVDATQCELDGNTWIDGPLVERVNNYTAVFVDGKGYQTANNVQEYVDTFDAEHGITAIIQQINDEGIITAAKEAQQWINASEGTITNMITQFVNKPDGINSNLAFAYDLIQANADENQVTATAQEQIALRLGTTELDLKNVSDGLATEAQARATQGSEIRLEFKSQDAAMLATAKDYTRAVTGYCVNDLGERVDQDDAALCIAGGNNWIDGPAVSRAIELSAAYVDGKGYQTQSDVTQSLNTFDSTYSVSATLQAFSANNTIKKANAAQQFINGAESYIESRIVDFNAADNGVDSKFSDVVQRLDAAEGVARTSISQITGIELDLKDKTFDDIVSEYSKFATTTDLTKVDVKASFADEKLKAQTTELESIAEQSVNLAALFNKNAALINSVTRAVANDEKASVIRDERYKAQFEENTARFSDVTTAIASIDEANVIRDQEMESFVFETASSFDDVAQTFASQEQAYTTLGQTLTAKIGNDTLEAKNAAIATAQQYTRTAVGYCVNAQGQISSESDAVACVASGGSWVAGPLAEFIENLQISEGGKTASIKQMRQVFKTVDGELVARGGWQLDNNGRAVGVVGYNDGQIGSLDLVGDVIRQGAMVGNTFVPTSYVDNTDPAKPLHVIRGRLELGDGHTVESLSDIKAQDGNDGSFVSFIYHATTNTNLAAPTGGTFNGTTETIPTNWQDAPYFVDGRVTYVSKARYVNNGTSWARGAWSKPSPYIIKGEKGSKGDTIKGDPGKRGAERETVGTTSGVWYDSVAKAAMPGGVAVLNDIVTIYKSGNPSVETTKRFNGSSWQSYTLRVHGSALIEDTLDGKVLRAGTRIESPRIDLIGNNFMKIELASGFGPENLWYWFGPKLMKNGLPDLNNLTRANATEWKDTNGNSFTKGTFISGSLESSVSTGHLVNNPSREIEFTSNGNLIHFAVSYSHRRTKEGPTDGDRASVLCPAQGFTPTSGTFYLERWIGNAWYVVHSRTFSGTYSCRNGEYEEEGEGSNMKTPNVAYYSTSISGGTFTFSQTPGSGYQRYRVRAQVNNFYAVSGVAQYLSLAVSEA